MKTNLKKELHQKTIEELRSLLQNIIDELFSLRLEKSQKKLKNTSLIAVKRKDLAIIQTILKEKELKNEKT